MTRAAANVPDNTALLCEYCGYNLTGLPQEGRCPECGRPVADSLPHWRGPCAWEQARSSADLGRFIRTSAAVLFRPSRFYRTLATRLDSPRGRLFGRIYLLVASILFATAAAFHLDWFLKLTGTRFPLAISWVLLVVLCDGFLIGVTSLASRLTTWEATYRGLRLPLGVVQRGMDFHAIHYLFPGLVAATTVLGYQWLLYHGHLGADSGSVYLYVLCGLIILFAGYLFQTYWIAMRNMMYANA